MMDASQKQNICPACVTGIRKAEFSGRTEFCLPTSCSPVDKEQTLMLADREIHLNCAANA